MYDPVLSSFLSPDNYMQDPTTQQGFNRYAYCMYNPLKYVDPSGERYYGYDEAAYFRMIEEMAQRVFQEWYSVYDMAVANVQLTINMACCLFGHGLDTHASGSGHHGAAGGGGCRAFTRFNSYQQNQGVNSSEGMCVLTSLGSILGGDSTAEWEARAEAYRATFNKNPFDPNNLIDFINWNPDPEIYHSYECTEIQFNEICEAMNNGYVVSFMCDFSEDVVSTFGLQSAGHFVNVSYFEIFENGCISMEFNDHPMNNYLHKYNSCDSDMFHVNNYKMYIYDNINDYRPIFNATRIIKILLNLKP